MMSSLISFIAPAIAAISFAYAIYQGRQKIKLEEFIRSEAWYLYSKSSNTNGQFQIAMGQYKQNHAGSLNPDFVECMGKGDGHGQDLTRETIRLIQLTEPDFSYEQIDKWVDDGKIHGGHQVLFKYLVVDPKRKSIGTSILGALPWKKGQ